MPEARINGAAARARFAVVLISDRPERFQALRRSALVGRTVYLWIADGARVPSWSVPLRGDPADAATYESLRGQETMVVVDLSDRERARSTARAASHAFALPAVLVIDHWHTERRRPARGGVTWIDEAELLTDAIEVVLRRMAARKRVRALRRALGGARSCAFLVQNDPDPDAIASALALRAALDLRPERSPIVTRGRVTRPENRRLIEELGVRVRHVSRPQLESLGPLVLVDVQPPYFRDGLPPVAAVVDHHPVSAPYAARFRDVRTSFGASATMTAEYLLAERPDALDTALATALLYGIVTDTKSLSRAASADDLHMFAELFLRADQAMLRRIQHPSYSPLALRRFGQAVQHVHVADGLACVHLGRLPEHEEHVVAQFADFCLGIAGAEVAAVTGRFGSTLVMSARALDPAVRLGDRLRTAFGAYGSAGGHPVMAKAVVELTAWRRDHRAASETALARSVQRALRAALDADLSPPSASPAPR